MRCIYFIALVGALLVACNDEPQLAADAGIAPTDSSVDTGMADSAHSDATLVIDAAVMRDSAIDSATADAVVEPSWGCYGFLLADGADCDCGCGVPDPDCADNTVASCEYDWCGNLGLYVDAANAALCTETIPTECGGIDAGGECADEGTAVQSCYFEEGGYVANTVPCAGGAVCGALIGRILSCILPPGAPCGGLTDACIADQACWCGTDSSCILDFASDAMTCMTGEDPTCTEATEEDTCIGHMYMHSCVPFALRADVVDDGRADYADCETLEGSHCVDYAGCLFLPGAMCDPTARFSGCGTSAADKVDCPETGVCPE